MTSKALEYLDQRARFGVKFGLDTTRRLLRHLGDPQRRFAVLLVAGTNGKGSVVAYVDAGLCRGGLRVGRYTSPHLVRLNERIEVPPFTLDADWDLARLLGYLESWSALGTYKSVHGTDPLDPLRERFQQAWGDPASTRRVSWPLTVNLGRVS